MGQEKAVNYEIPTHTLFGGGAPAGSVVHRERHTVPHHRAQHPQHRRARGFTVAGISLVNRTVTLTLDEKTDIRKVTIDKAEFDVATSNPMMTDKEKFISQIRTSQPLSGEFDLRAPALCHALALPGLRVDDRGRAAHSPVVHRRRADRIDTDRHAGAYGHGLCRRRHRPEGRHGHQPQAGACRHHRLLAHCRGTFRHGLRNGSSGRRHLPRPHGALDAPCPSPPT